MVGRRPPAVRVVTVPDFAGPSRRTFETRSLFFLAFWAELPAAPGIVLHLACIGEPPEAVRRMADMASASWTVHEPLGIGSRRNPNKLRGLEGAGADEAVLLLDTDVWLLADLTGWERVDGDFAVSPALKPRISLARWESLYGSLGEAMPSDRFPCVRHRLGRTMRSRHAFEGQGAQGASMVPYYNSGVLLARQPGLLREAWEAALRDIAAVVSSDDPFVVALLGSDQAALALALQRLGRDGAAISLLPDAYHWTYLHLSAGEPLATARALHALGFPGPGHPEPARAPDLFGHDLARRLRREAWSSGWPPGRAVREWGRWRGAATEARRLAERLRRLWAEVIEPVTGRLAEAGGDTR